MGCISVYPLVPFQSCGLNCLRRSTVKRSLWTISPPRKIGETLPILTCVWEVRISNPYGGFHDFPQPLHISTYGTQWLGKNLLSSTTLQFVIHESSCRQFNSKNQNYFTCRKQISCNDKERQPETTTACKVHHNSL